MDAVEEFLHPRYRVAQQLLKKPGKVSELAKELGIKKGTMWHYLTEFVRLGLASRTKVGGVYVYKPIVAPEEFMASIRAPRLFKSPDNDDEQGEKPSPRAARCVICGSEGLLVKLPKPVGRFFCPRCLGEISRVGAELPRTMAGRHQ